jgi:addiction module RelE/StbE family toxin
MIVLFAKRFEKQRAKFPVSIRRQLDKKLSLFIDNPFNLVLNNHEVHYPYSGFRSINISGDIRALYEIVSDDTVLFSHIGTHSELYK